VKHDLDHARELLSAMERLVHKYVEPVELGFEGNRLLADVAWALNAWGNNYGPVLDSESPKVRLPAGKSSREVQTYHGSPVSVPHSVDWKKPAAVQSDACPFCAGKGERHFSFPPRVEDCLVCAGTGTLAKERV